MIFVLFVRQPDKQANIYHAQTIGMYRGELRVFSG